MKRNRFSEEQIIGIARETEWEETIKAVCAKHNNSEAGSHARPQRSMGLQTPAKFAQSQGVEGSAFGLRTSEPSIQTEEVRDT